MKKLLAIALSLVMVFGLFAVRGVQGAWTISSPPQRQRAS